MQITGEMIIGSQLVRGSAGEVNAYNPATREEIAPGFTGSRGGGTALMRAAAARLEPIPVYAEMSSVNPVFLLPAALEEGGAALAQGFVDSLTLGVGQFCTNPGPQDEVFGPAALVVRVDSAEQLHGQLTATVHVAPSDHPLAARLLPVLERKAGQVSHAMVHGGPFPATSDSRSTSVGASAIDRFLRPVCYQNVPQGLLPEALRDDNPLRLARVADGDLKGATWKVAR